MAITALATTNTTIGPAQFADMAQALAPRFLVDSPSHLQPSYSGGNVGVTSGAALVSGTRIRVTGTEYVAIPSVPSGTRTYSVVIRVDWSKGANDAATLVALPTTTINASSSPNTGQINRIPGVLYDALLATVTRQAGSSVALNFTDLRMWGGDGGPIRVGDAAMTNPNMLDARAGTMISTDQNVYTKRRDNDMVWRAVGTDSNPWRVWTPTLRYYGDKPPNGTSGGTVAGLGNGGTMQARYRIVDGMLDGFVYISPGATGATLGRGQITMDVPFQCASWQEDTWSMGHLYTRGYGADGNFDWPMQGLIKRGWTRCGLWTHPIANDVRLEPYRAQAGTGNGGAGTGTPFVKNGFPVGDITMHIQYPVTEV